MGASSSPRRPPAARHVLLSAIAVAGSLTAAYVVQGIGGWISATPTTVQAAPLAGTAALSGTVESTAPFKAAQVFIRNVDKRMLYTVYTQAGQFRAVNLFPGNYEISVATKGLDSEVQKLVLKAGTNPKVTLALRESNAEARDGGASLRRDLSAGAWPRRRRKDLHRLPHGKLPAVPAHGRERAGIRASTA